MIDKNSVLDVMKKGGSLDEGAAMCDVSVAELLNACATSPELAKVVARGCTACKAWWSRYLRNNATTNSTNVTAIYLELMHEMKAQLDYLQEVTKVKSEVCNGKG
jgi:hypothetical protein